MCEWTQEYLKYASQGYYGSYKVTVEYGHCPACAGELTQEEMWPPGRCSRSMHTSCYTRAFRRITPVCIMCSSDIFHKDHLQQQNWREIGHHICDDPKCRAKFAYIHSTVVGLPHAQQNYLPPYNQPHVQPASQVQHVQSAQNSSEFQRWAQARFGQGQIPDADVMDAEYVEVNPQPRAIPARQVRQLPAPERLMTVESFFGQSGSNNQEKEPILVDLTRKD